MRVDLYEVAQKLPMKKRGHFTKFSGFTKRNHNKKLPTECKKYKYRRASIKRGELGAMARFGSIGCSSWWW